MTATNKITTEKIKATSGISVTKTASSTTEEPTKRTNIDTDLDIQNNFRQNTTKPPITTGASGTVKKTTQSLEETVVPDLEIDTSSENNTKHGLYHAIYSEEFTFFMILLLVVVFLCCCYYFLWRYTKLPLLPLKSKTDCSFTKEIFREKNKAEKFCFANYV